MAVSYSIKKNRLERAYVRGAAIEGEGTLRFEEEAPGYFVALRGIDSATDDAAWGRLYFDLEIPETMALYVYAVAVNQNSLYEGSRQIPLDEYLRQEDWSDGIRRDFFHQDGALRFVGKSDILLYQLRGRYLYLGFELVGRGGGSISRIRVQRGSDTFYSAFPEVYHENDSFFHRLISVYSSMYNDFEDEIAGLPELLDPDTCPGDLLPIYASWLGIDISGDYLSEEVCRTLVKEAYALNRLKGTRACIERLLEIVLGEKVLVLEQNTIRAYQERGEMLGTGLVQDSIYDVNILIRKSLTKNDRFQILYLLDQFKPLRSRIHLIPLKDSGLLDSNTYLDMNAQVSANAFALLDEEKEVNGHVVLG